MIEIEKEDLLTPDLYLQDLIVIGSDIYGFERSFPIKFYQISIIDDIQNSRFTEKTPPKFGLD